MNTKALITLEYDKIIKKLETFASSTMGKALCKDLLPSSDYEEILSAQTETKDALTRLYKTGYLSFQGLSDIRPHLRLLEIDSTLNTKELLDIARLLSITFTEGIFVMSNLSMRMKRFPPGRSEDNSCKKSSTRWSSPWTSISTVPS